jgi:hypothetical protein
MCLQPSWLSSSATYPKSPEMSVPNVDDIIEKAKQLCRLDGMVWSSLDFQNPMAMQSRARMASDADRRRYMKRAQTLLETQTRLQ